MTNYIHKVRQFVRLLLLAGTLVAATPLADATTVAPRWLVSVQYGQGVGTSLPIVRLTFPHPVLATSLPPLKSSPTLATSWEQVSPTMVQAVATAAPVAGGGYRIDVPTSVRCTTTCVVVTTTPYVTPLTVPTIWQNQLMAELHYLPVRFVPTVAPTTAEGQAPGVFLWRFPKLPHSLQTVWSSTQPSVILSGALMHFQSVHNLPVTGAIDVATWRLIVHDVRHHIDNPSAYNYVDVTETVPETATLYVNGQPTFHTLANTGIAQAPTALGTFPVYLRYQSQTMQGTNPDGSHYYDTGIPWVSYFHGGDALHGFLRSSYGFPQSLGCVEMPLSAAGSIWPYTPIGTLVTVRP